MADTTGALLELLAEVGEISGRDLRLDGKAWLMTTETDIRHWIAWHIHQETYPGIGTDAAVISRCRCGWDTGPRETWVEASKAIDAHTSDEIQKLVSGA